ncbi:MAG TPA: polysaccharide deacetylase family protein [Micromonospora sp.]
MTAVCRAVLLSPRLRHTVRHAPRGRPHRHATSRRRHARRPPAAPQRTAGVTAVALTFDDGPHPVWTPKILDELRAARVRAIFCVIGSQVTKYPELVARIARDGHTLCNHSWNHDRQLGARSVATIRANLTRTTAAIEKAAPGASVRFFRPRHHPPPQGAVWNHPPGVTSPQHARPPVLRSVRGWG